MKNRCRALVVLALLAALVGPAARAGVSEKLTPADVRAVDTEDSETLNGFRAVYKGMAGIVRGCPIVKAHAQARSVWVTVVESDRRLAEIHSRHFSDLAEEVNGFLKQVDAYPDPADQKQLSRGVNDMALGLRMRAGAVDTYISALRKAEAFDCAGFAADAGKVLSLLNKSHARYVPGFDELIHLALEH